MTNFNAILDYARLIGNLKEVINKEEYTVASNVCEELAKRKIGITDEYLNNAEEECNKVLAIIKDIRGTRLAAKADLNNITDADRQAFENKIKVAKAIKAVVPKAGSDYDIDKEAVDKYYMYGDYGNYIIGYGKVPDDCRRFAKNLDEFVKLTTNYIIRIAKAKGEVGNISETAIEDDVQYAASCIYKGEIVNGNKLNYPYLFGYLPMTKNCDK